MEIILKRLTETGDFANEFVVLAQQKPVIILSNFMLREYDHEN